MKKYPIFRLYKIKYYDRKYNIIIYNIILNMSSSKNSDKNQPILIYDYYDTNIYNPYEKDLEKNGYIKIPFQNSKSTIQPNLILPNNEKYKIENIYFYKKKLELDIVKEEYNGELIIEHSPITNGEKKVYVCILLKTRPNIYEDSDIDKIIKKSFSDKMKLNLNNFIENMNSSCLVNKDNNIFIFKTPLLISSKFDEFSDVEKTILPKFDKNELKIIQTQSSSPSGESKTKKTDSIKESFKEGLAVGEDVFIDCNPVDSSDTTVSMVPVNSDSLIDPSAVVFMSTIQNFFIFIVLLIIISVSVPSIYKNVIMGFVEKVYANKPNKNNYLFSVDMIILVVLFGIFFGLLVDGVSNNNKLQTSIGIFFFICFTLIILIMTVLKIMSKENYNFLDDFTNNATGPSAFDISLEMFLQSLMYILSIFKDGWNLLFLVLSEIFYFLFSHYYLNYDINDKSNTFYYFSLTFFVIFVSVVIIRIFKSDI